ncbi:MAG: YraN family protein [Muribaculaceae bacterium]|nr:YraN family protein [Muribaculaceae bacterium]MDE6332651.1 YraN family protein [Muribaculaceae bacterium]
MKTDELGKWGEELAVQHLMGQGYAIVQRNWRVDHFETDIVAMKNGRIIFVEVKTRSDQNSDPLEAIDRKKILNLVRSANAYVQMYDIPHEIQFDVITVTGSQAQYRLEHLPDAFTPPLKSY